MHSIILDGALTVQMALAAVLAGYALFDRGVARRLLLLETLTLVFVSALAVLALRRQEPGYLDIALVMSLLGFAQTVGVARSGVFRSGK